VGTCCRVFALLTVVLAASAVRAEVPPADATWRVRSDGPLAVDGGLLLASPAALSTGLSQGVSAGAAYGRRLALGARASWSSTTESSIAWQVTHGELRLRATVALQHAAGRGRFGLRLGLGPTVVHEGRLRNQGMRAGLTGDALATSAFALLPAAELEAVVAVHIAGPWLLTTSGGPSLAIVDGDLHAGWVGLLGVGWQP
jgi:hypothetical protein